MHERDITTKIPSSSGGESPKTKKTVITYTDRYVLDNKFSAKLLFLTSRRALHSQLPQG
jgi:hypothetical protein